MIYFCYYYFLLKTNMYILKNKRKNISTLNFRVILANIILFLKRKLAKIILLVTKLDYYYFEY